MKGPEHKAMYDMTEDKMPVKPAETETVTTAIKPNYGQAIANKKFHGTGKVWKPIGRK